MFQCFRTVNFEDFYFNNKKNLKFVLEHFFSENLNKSAIKVDRQQNEISMLNFSFNSL